MSKQQISIVTGKMPEWPLDKAADHPSIQEALDTGYRLHTIQATSGFERWVAVLTKDEPAPKTTKGNRPRALNKSI